MIGVDSPRIRKINRLLSGEPLRVLELCSGCGGMSLGLKAAGFSLLAHVESDPIAVASHAKNLAPSETRDAWSKPRDMISCSPESLVSDFGIGGVASEAFDVLAAGLPCQAFARIGRSKLRSLTGDEEAFKNDPRASLYRRFLEYVQSTQPLAILIENVPDILNFGGRNVPEEICATLEAMGYRARYTLLNAAFYGVPQLRERLFLIAVDESLGIDPPFPLPTHHALLPKGYESSRCVALKHVSEKASHFHPIPEPGEGLPDAISVEEALSDLPVILEHFTAPATMKRRKVGEFLPYRTGGRSVSGYADAMRRWPDLESVLELDGHVVRVTPRDFPIFQGMPCGADYPEALRIAVGLFQERLNALAEEGCCPGADSPSYVSLKRSIVPPYDATKFPNKWWKLDPAAPSRTLTAHMGKDTYSHIHYDGLQRRTISVREAARLQSFPDAFRFAGSMNAAFRQIGNAVPPLLSLAIARSLRQAFLGLSLKKENPDDQRAA